MIPITEEQELTLRRWASTVGKRPRKKDKAFLQAEKGITEEQIDSWWQNVDPSPQAPVDMVVASVQPQPEPPIVFSEVQTQIQDGGMEIDEVDAGGPSYFDSYYFEAIDEDFVPPAPAIPSSLAELENWSPMEHIQEDFTNPAPPMLDIHNQLWDSAALGSPNYHHCSTILESPRFPPPNHRRSKTESHSSSANTWDTASTLVSLCDMYVDSIEENKLEGEVQVHEAVAPMKLTSPLQSSTIVFPQQPVPINQEPIAPPPPPPPSAQSHFPHPSDRFPVRSSSISRGKPGNPPAPLTFYPPLPPPPHQQQPQPQPLPHQRTQSQPILSNNTPASSAPGKYICTVCHRPFNRKGDWKRHEEKHDPQTQWICLLGEPAILATSPSSSLASSWKCVFCGKEIGSAKGGREEMIRHLMKVHKIQQCVRKKEEKMWGRKDKLKQHLVQVHGLKEEGVGGERGGWEGWCRNGRRKWAWGCGFCGGCLFTWEGRLSHIATHYEKDFYTTSHWSNNLIIKGLLKQCFPDDFNVHAEWKDALSRPHSHSDRHFDWPEAIAKTLKHKLEYHEGSAREIAKEAHRWASVKARSSAEVLASWTGSNLREGSLASPVTDRWQTIPQPGSRHPNPPIDIEMEGDLSNYI